jgi:S-adenosylmethionine hydrolase
VFAPVAAHLSKGVDPEELGPIAPSWAQLDWPKPQLGKHAAAGEVVFVDRFGNLITNIPGAAVQPNPAMLTIGRRKLRSGFRWVNTYGDAPAGSLVVLVSSVGALEVAEAQGNAAKRLRAGVGTPIGISWKDK